MAAFTGEVSVFIDTNLGTRIAMNVPQDITAGALKRDFERVHFTCLPNSGEIKVDGLMVKRKSCFYHLPDSMLIKYAFHGMRSTWFLHVEASHLKNVFISQLPQAVATLSEPQDLMTCNAKVEARGNNEEKRMEGFHTLMEEHENTVHISKKQKKKKKKKKMKKFNEKYMQNASSAISEGFSCMFEAKPTGTTNKSQFILPTNEVENSVKLNANSMQGSPSEMSTEVVSVTGIINKYFCNLNGVDNFGSPSHSDVTSRAVHREIEDKPKIRTRSCSKTQIDSFPQFTPPKTPPTVLRAPLHVDLVSEISGHKSKESKVRKRLLLASQSLGNSVNKPSPSISLCKFKDGKLLQHKSLTKGSLFEISDSDD